MQSNTAVLVLGLTLILLASFPTMNVATVHGVVQNGPTTWSPFGPREKKLTITEYSDPSTMFNAFRNGQVDITDWPIQSLADLNSFQNNPDFFVTDPTQSFLYYNLEINSHSAFMGIALTSPRSTVPAAFTLGQSTPTCSAGFGSLTIALRNQETSRTILDSLNTITVANQPSGLPFVTVSDQGGATPTGIYQTACLLAGSYTLTSDIYNATGATATISSNLNRQGVLNVNYNSPSNVNPTVARSELGAALAHMIDKTSFSSSFAPLLTSPLDTLTTMDVGLARPTQVQINAAECQFNNHPWLNVCNGNGGNDLSAYNIAADSISAGSEWWQTAGAAIGVGLGYSGHDDLRGACDDLVSMGLAISPAGATCDDVANAAAAGTTPLTSYPHVVPQGNIIYYIRSVSPRKEYGTIIADTLNFLFGTPSSSGGGTVCYGACPQFVPKYYTITQVAGIIFSPPSSWQLYTDQIDPPYPDSLYALWNSAFAGTSCHGTAGTSEFSNWDLYCNPAFDSDTFAGAFTNNATLANQLFSRASYTGLVTSLLVPVVTEINQIAGLNGWNFQQCNGSSCGNTQSSLVNTLGFGLGGFGAGSAYWSFLNMHQVPGYVPSSPMYAPGGGDPNLIRRAFSQDTDNVSPFQAGTAWDSEFFGLIFDSMLQVNPLTAPDSTGQLVDWQTTGHSSGYNPSEVGCNVSNGCVTGVTTQLWHLRNDLKFQDGNPVTANDVGYSIIAYRDVPSGNLQGSVSNVVSAVSLDCGMGQPCKTLEAKLQGASPSNEINIGTLPILEKSLWAPFCGNPPSPTSPCANYDFDPMAAGIMVGDGPWECVVPAGFPNAGHVGGPCSVNADGTLGGQAVTTNGKFLLTRYDGFARCCPDDTPSSLYKLSWADVNNDGVINILDLASAAVRFGQPDPYWVNPIIAPGATVNIQDLATVAFYFGHGTTYPFKPSQLTGLDPQIDPFFCPNTGC